MTLHQAHILVTREKQQGKSFSEKLRAHDGVPIEVPLLEITCEPTEENEKRLNRLSGYQWMFFTSANGVKYFYELIDRYHIPRSSFGQVRIAVVGHKTQKALQLFGQREADFIPTVYDADHMAEEFIHQFTPVGKILLVRGSLSRPNLPEHLQHAGVPFDMVEVYETNAAYGSKELLNRLLQNETIDFLTFTSPSAVAAYEELADEKLREMVCASCVCIGNTTRKKAESAGFKNILFPEEYTIEGMITCIENHLEKRNDK